MATVMLLLTTHLHFHSKVMSNVHVSLCKTDSHGEGTTLRDE